MKNEQKAPESLEDKFIFRNKTAVYTSCFAIIFMALFLFSHNAHAYSVQSGTSTMEIGTATLDITLDTPVTVGNSVPMVTCNGTYSSPSRTFCRASLITEVDGNYTELEVYRTSNNLGSMGVSWQVVEHEDFTVQTGLSTIETSAADIAITAADLSKSFIIVSAANNSGHSYNGPVQAKFNSTTEINLTKGNYGSGIYTYVRWYVVEWESASVQSGSVTLSGATSTTDAISEIDLDNSFLLHSFTTNQTNYPARVFPIGQFTSTTSIEFARGSTTGENDISYFVVTSPDISTQRGALEVTGASETATITPVSLSSSFLVTPSTGNGRHDIDAYSYIHSFLNTQALTDTSTVTVERGDTTGTLTAYWQVVSLADVSVSPSSSNGSSYIHPPTCQANFSPNTITQGETATLSWNITWPTEKQGTHYTRVPGPDGGLFSHKVSSIQMTPQHSQSITTYTFNLWGANSCTAEIEVLDVNGQEVVSERNSKLTASAISSDFFRPIISLFSKIFVR